MLGVKNIHSFLLVAGTVIAFASSVESYVNCRSTSSIEAHYKSCLHEEGIDIKVTDHQSASLEDALASEHADVMCSHQKESYKRAMECIGRVTRQCMPEEYKFLLPMPHQWGEMMSRICDNRQELDLKCATRQSHASKDCGQRKSHQYLQERGTPTESEVKCWAFEAEFECTLELYSSCSCMTAKVYSDIVLDIMMSPSCRSKELEARRLVCETHAKAPLPALPDHVTADCQSVSALKSGVVECFTNEQIRDDHLFESYQNSASPPNTIIETLFLRYGDAACSSQKLRYQEAFKCTLQLLRDCMPAEYKNFLPSPDTAAAHIEYLCRHRKDMDLLCASKKTAALKACGKNKAMKYVADGGSVSSGLLCFAYKAEFQCSQEVYKACGCETAKAYSDMSLDLRYPKTCARKELEDTRIHCQSPILGPAAPGIKTPDQEGTVTYDMESPQCMQSKRPEIKKCYTDRGFTFYEDGRTSSTHIFFGSILDVIMNENNACNDEKIQEAKYAVRCEAEIIHNCLSNELKVVFSDTNTLTKILEGLCDKSQEIHGRCAYRQMLKFGSCIETPAKATFTDLTYRDQKACHHVTQLGDCARDILLTCGCPTAKVYSDLIFNVMLPPVCRKSDDAPQGMKCDATNPYAYKFIHHEGNGASRLPCTIWSLAIALCLARLIFRNL